MTEDDEKVFLKELKGIRICLVVLAIITVLSFVVDLLNIRI